jgi:hypothetical protein
MADDFSQKTPSKTKMHTSSYAEFLGTQLGDIDYNQAWNNFFPQVEASYKLILQVEDALKPKKVNDRWSKPIINIIKYPELTPRPTPIFNFKQIWDGGCCITKQRDPHNPTRFIAGAERFHYSTKTLDKTDRYQVSLPLIALDNATPIGQLKTDEWGVRISEAVPFLLAFDECVYDTVIRDGKFYYNQGGKIIAKFQPTDMKSITKKTHRVGRPYYYKVIKLLKNKILENWSLIENDFHRLIYFLEQGIDEEFTLVPEHSNKSVIGNLED